MRCFFAAVARPLIAISLLFHLTACEWILNAPGWSTSEESGEQSRPGFDVPRAWERELVSPAGGQPTLPLENDLMKVEFSNLGSIKGALVRERFQMVDRDELLLAAAICQCVPRWSHKVLVRTLESNGPLPQVLVPQIREAILRDKRVQAVINLPGGPEGVISRLFASDTQLESTIRSNILSMIQVAWQNPLKIGASQAINFDAFTPPPWRVPAPQGGRAVRPEGFDVGTLASRWLLIANAVPPWTAGPGRSRADLPLEQDILLVSWARMMAEINYILGIKRGFDNRIYGGLLVNPHDNTGALLGFEMLPESGAPMLALSGQVRVAYQPMSSLRLIVNGNEKWQRQPGTIDLHEQTRVWRAGAAIFRGLRQESRKYPAAIFGAGDANLFPANAQRLGLAFLQGMQVLLGEEFIALDTLTIGDNFSIPEQRVQRAESDLVSMVRVAGASAAWLQELQSLDSSGLAEDDKATLRSGLPKLQDAVRLGVLRGLRRAIDWGAFDASQSPGKALPLARQAELIATFAAIEQDMMRSGYVRRKIAVFAQRMIESLSTRLNQGSYVDLTPEEAIWVREALVRVKKYSSNEAEFAAFLQSLETGLKAWDLSAAI
ncbi:MAG: hypothetical protein RIQ81_1889 [Pseudomonadota bacterium]|jgi:hypothetical protein